MLRTGPVPGRSRSAFVTRPRSAGSWNNWSAAPQRRAAAALFTQDISSLEIISSLLLPPNYRTLTRQPPDGSRCLGRSWLVTSPDSQSTVSVAEDLPSTDPICRQLPPCHRRNLDFTSLPMSLLPVWTLLLLISMFCLEVFGVVVKTKSSSRLQALVAAADCTVLTRLLAGPSPRPGRRHPGHASLRASSPSHLPW